MVLPGTRYTIKQIPCTADCTAALSGTSYPYLLLLLLFILRSDNDVQHELQHWSLLTFPKEENLGNKRKPTHQVYLPSSVPTFKIWLVYSICCPCSFLLSHYVLSLNLVSCIQAPSPRHRCGSVVLYCTGTMMTGYGNKPAVHADSTHLSWGEALALAVCTGSINLLIDPARIFASNCCLTCIQWTRHVKARLHFFSFSLSICLLCICFLFDCFFSFLYFIDCVCRACRIY